MCVYGPHFASDVYVCILSSLCLQVRMFVYCPHFTFRCVCMYYGPHFTLRCECMYMVVTGIK